jgi:putative hydrolase of the HAD superfamily
MITNLTGIKHISFDMWNTLISANSHYAKERNQYYATKYNLDVAFVSSVYTRVKNELDAVSSRCHTTESCHVILGQQLGVDNFDVVDSMNTLRKLFVLHPPKVLLQTITMLNTLTDMGFTLSIASNTNFISGHILDMVLVHNWRIPFAFGVYSDLFGHAKPDELFFNEVKRLTHAINPTIENSEILHVGDNPKCDHDGALAAGLSHLLIDNPLHLTEIMEKLYDCKNS